MCLSPDGGSEEDTVIAADMTKYDSPMAELDKRHNDRKDQEVINAASAADSTCQSSIIAKGNKKV